MMFSDMLCYGDYEVPPQMLCYGDYRERVAHYVMIWWLQGVAYYVHVMLALIHTLCLACYV